MDSPLSTPPPESVVPRALEMFNRRGSVIAVMIGGKGSADVINAASGAPSSAPLSGPSEYGDKATSKPSTSMISGDFCSTASDPDGRDDGRVHEWRPPYPRLCAYHDVNSLGAAWSLGQCPSWLEMRPTGASQAQSPTDDDNGDGKQNELLTSCPNFRNEIGCEPIRRVALSRQTKELVVDAAEVEGWQREHTAAEAGVLEDVSNVYLGGRLCAARQPKNVIEPQDLGGYYYRHCFAGRPHIEYFGMDDELGPIAVSIVKEDDGSSSQVGERKRKSGSGSTAAEKAAPPVASMIYRMVIRISELKPIRLAIPEEMLSEPAETRSTRALMRELIELTCPRIPFSCLRPALQSHKIEEMLMKMDEQPMYTRYKIGVLLCMRDQSSEEQMYNNEFSTPAFEEFLDFLGQRVRLKGFDAYKGGLDTRGDTTGTHSVYVEYQAHDVMFHVSTLLPYTSNNRQQLSRKRHIGNDMVTLIFQEPGALPFSPLAVRSHFQHVFIIVRVNEACSENTSYSVAVSRSKDVPSFGPPLPPGAAFTKCADFHDWLLTKIINAENAVHRSKKFATMAARTRREALRDLAENYVGPHANDGAARIASRLLGGSVKRKGDKGAHKKPAMACTRGALSWLVDVHDHSLNTRVSCVLGLSADAMVLLERPTGACIFATPTHSIIGWANTEMGLRLYYDHSDSMLLRCVTESGTDEELSQLLERLQSVTKGDEAKEVVLRRPSTAHPWGFHLHDEGVVTDVEMYQTAWKAGLRQGSRIVEVEGQNVATLSIEDLAVIVRERDCMRLLLLSPAPDGSPRRGCEDPNCPAVKGNEQMLTPDAFAKQPLTHFTYQEMFRLRNREYSQGSSSGSFEERSSYRESTSASKNNLCGTNSGPTLSSSRVASSPCCGGGVGGACGAQLRGFGLAAAHSSASVHDHICTLLNPPKPLNRALSDELLRLSFSGNDTLFGTARSARESISSELAHCQVVISQLMEDKRQLENSVQKLTDELAMERKAHDDTRAELDRLRSPDSHSNS
ncbi:hypothetical protein PFISCL1PPCAC_1067 [Pristionchus fissidentatus]|uniref:Rap-GAP domain-containing protein n=1 Tax=Pristionchus fissidentatus TaxID=1538716 RepID=A0AAV5URH1_9BILA|nr:hypothetical protein PFISCL1PPCAC_1067 [Pristionchus fissidentatus]